MKYGTNKSLDHSYFLEEEISYFNDLEQISKDLLTKEQEILLLKQIQQGDIESRNLLIESNLRLVIFVAKKYANCGLSFFDLVQEGNLGLIYAAIHFNVQLDKRFSTYAYACIDGYIKRLITRKNEMIARPCYLIDYESKIDKLRKKLKVESQIELTDEDILKYLNISPKVLSTIKKYPRKKVFSLEELMEKETEFMEEHVGIFLASTYQVDGFKEYEQLELKEVILDSFACLSEKEKYIVKLYYGFIDDELWSGRQIAKFLGITQTRVEQIKRKALRKLRNKLSRIVYE